MTLQDRKIPIITGINDVPSVTGGEKHPNASLLCKNYNDLIDNELNEKLPPYTNTQGHPLIFFYYIDAVNGSDTNDASDLANAIQTFDRLHELIAEKKTYGYIEVNIRGTFTNPDLDFTKHKLISFDPYYWWQNSVSIFGNNEATINIDKQIYDRYTNVYNIEDESAKQVIRSNISVYIYDVTFTFTPLASLLLDRINLHFWRCTFNATNISFGQSLITITNSNLTLNTCIVELPTNNDFIFSAHCYIALNGITGTNIVNGNDSNKIVWGEYNTVFLNCLANIRVGTVYDSLIVTRNAISVAHQRSVILPMRADSTTFTTFTPA